MQSVCSQCGQQALPLTKTPTWAIVCAILLFPIGLLFLLSKTTVCPICKRPWAPRMALPPGQQPQYPQQPQNPQYPQQPPA